MWRMACLAQAWLTETDVDQAMRMEEVTHDV
jgi:hypothetical protein